jgi:hypothetical protein
MEHPGPADESFRRNVGSNSEFTASRAGFNVYSPKYPIYLACIAARSVVQRFHRDELIGSDQ